VKEWPPPRIATASGTPGVTAGSYTALELNKVPSVYPQGGISQKEKIP
jgi:hypothetical protein